MKVFYNDNEPFAVRWLSGLVKGGVISPGDVNGESIIDLEAWQLAGYDWCHFFAGIGGWDLALRLAGWPATIKTFTGSCPCQPFSVAGKRKGTSDVRHLWPYFREHIRQHRPSVIFGEQVASKDGREWLAGVRADLEAMGYAVGAADLCAAGIRSPHIRQRLYWVAHSNSAGQNEWTSGGKQSVRAQDYGVGRLADAQCAGAESRRSSAESDEGSRTQGAGSPVEPGRCSDVSRLADAEYDDRWADFSGRRSEGGDAHQRPARGLVYSLGTRLEGLSRYVTDGDQSRWKYTEQGGSITTPGSTGGGVGDTDENERRARRELLGGDEACEQRIPTIGSESRVGIRSSSNAGGFWDRFELIPCADGKARRIEPGTFPLANGISRRMDKLRGYGNAIVPELAAEFIKSFMEVL